MSCWQVRLGDELGAISYGRAEVAGKDVKGSMAAAERERLTDTLSLLAYEDPASSPHGSLMAMQARAELAEAVDKAILQHSGQLQHSTLEHLLRSLVRLGLCVLLQTAGSTWHAERLWRAGGPGKRAEKHKEHCGSPG